MNIFALQSDETALFIRLCEDDGTEDNQVIVNVEIGRGLVFKQSSIVAPYIEKFAVDFNLGAGNAVAVDDFVEVFEHVVGRYVSDVRGNGTEFIVAFESENPKQ